MKKMMKKWLPLLLVFTMLAGLLSGCGNAKQTATAADIDDGIKKPEFQRVPVDYTESDAEFYELPAREVAEFSAMSRDLFDRDLFCSIVAEMQELGAKEGNLNKLKGLWNALIDAHDQVNTAYTLQNIKYYQDNSDENGDALTQLELELTEVADYMCLVLQKLLQSDLYGAAMQDYINSELVVDDILNYNAMTERAFELQEEKSNLVQEYYSLYYSEDDVSEDLADIYLKILDNLIESNEINGYGFPDYAQYAYEKGFQRDFSPEEAQELYAWTREFIVPWFMQTIYTIQMSYGQQLNEYYSMDMTEDEIVSRVKPYVTTVSEKAAEAFECMQENHLFDLAASETKNEGGFTTSINWYGVPFIFSQHEGSASDAETLVHEFGHAYEGYVNAMPVMYEYACIDIAEIDSQGMEMLMMKNAADIFGEDVAETAELMSLYHVFTGVIDGCIFDEFQQRALQGRMDGSIQTTADLTELFLSIEESYYGKGVYNWGEQWMMVPHTFESPFYYISYATSATAALGILAISQENYDEAVSMYNELVDYGNNNGFMETLDVIGLPNPLTEAGQQIITENLTPFFYQMFGLDAE